MLLCCRIVFCCLMLLLSGAAALAQTATYHLHAEASAITQGDLQLKSAGPDAAASALLSTDLSTFSGNGNPLIAIFETQSGVPGQSGTLASGSTATFKLWMRVTGSSGTIYPALELDYGTGVWTVTGTTALTNTLTQYTITATLPSAATVATSDRAVLKVSAKIQSAPFFTNQAELDIEGALNGNYDSQVVIPLPPPPISVSITSPTNGAQFSAIASIAITASASETGGTISNVAFFSGSTMIGQVSGSSPYTFNWTGVIAGNYTLTAKATDSNGNTATSAAVPIVVSGTGFLSGSMPTVIDNPLNLTNLGPSFWAHWGYGGATGFDSKKCFAQQISNVTPIGSGSIQADTYPRNFNWTDGTPTASQPQTNSAISITGLNNGLQISVAADGTSRTLTVLVGVANATGQMKAFLSDGQAPLYTDSSISNNSGVSFGAYVFNFHAGSPYQTLIIQYTVATDFSPPNGSVKLAAAYMSGKDLPVSAPVISSINTSLAAVGTPVTITGTDFGPNQFSSTVSFNGVVGVPTSWNSTSILVPVPVGATSGNVVVTTLCGASNGFPLAVLQSGSISGKVTNAATSRPVAGAIVQALQSGTTIGSAVCDSAGNYAINNLPVGVYDVTASAVGFGVATITGNSVAAGGVTTVNLAMSLAQPGSITGKVFAADGVTPVAGASLAFSQGGVSAGSSLTDSTGAYSLSGLVAGSYNVVVMASGFSPQAQNGITVLPGTSTTVNFTLAGASVIYNYDALGRLISVTDPASDTAVYSYDAVGNLLSISRHPSSSVSIIGFSPAAGTVGTLVAITGTGFSATLSQNSVTFNGAAAMVLACSPGQIIAAVPSAATTGTISVTSPGGSATSSSSFTVQTALPTPTITSFSPTIGNPGSSLTINGTNYQTQTSMDRASINSGLAVVTAASATSLTATVPQAAPGHVSVSTPSGIAVSSGDFIVPPPGYDISQIDFAARVSLGGTARASITTTQHIALVLFDAFSGKNVNITVSGVTLPTGAVLTVLSPNLGTLATATLTAGSTSVVGPVTIPGDGTYTVMILGTNGAGAATVEVDGRGLTVTQVSPAAGPITGGTAVTITGSGFVAGTRVTLGGAVATNVSINSTSSITATTPSHAAGAVNVAVTTMDGRGGDLVGGFTFNPPPTVSQVSPGSGTAAGGISVTITGTNFVTGATVTFGGTAATGVTVSNATTITATTPAHAAGAVNVAVSNPDGQTGTLTNGFTFLSTGPNVTSVSPTNGPSTGGQAVTITGSNFVTGATVTFGGTAATGVTVSSSTSITATTPAHAAGAVNVTVTNPNNQSGTLTNGYTYNPGPLVTAISPTVGPTGGGTSVTITGSNFVSGATVTIGGVAATGVSFVNSTTLTATSPAHSSTSADVVVANPDGQTGTLTRGFTYALLDDPFSGSSLDTSKWAVGLITVTANTSIGVSETGGVLRIGNTLTGTSGNNYNGIKSNAKYDLTGAYAYVQEVQPPPNASLAEGQISVVYTSQNWYGIEVVGSGSNFGTSKVICRKNVNGTVTQLNLTNYDSTNHQFLRIRNDSASGNVVFEAAPNNGGAPGTWTQLYAEAWNSQINMASVNIEIRAGTSQSSSTAGTVQFANLRVAKP